MSNHLQWSLLFAGIWCGCTSDGARGVADGGWDTALADAPATVETTPGDGAGVVRWDGSVDLDQDTAIATGKDAGRDAATATGKDAATVLGKDAGRDAGKDTATDAGKDTGSGPDRRPTTDTDAERDSATNVDTAMDTYGAADTSEHYDAGQGPGTGSIPVGSDGILQIWTVGDSITEGVNNGYRNRLWQALRADGYAVDFLGTEVHPYPDTAVCSDADHDGHPGYTVGGIQAEIADWYATIAPPDVVLLMAGTNDLAWWVADARSAVSSAEEMMTLVDTILGFSGQMRIIVSTIPPMAPKVIEEPQVDRALLGREFNTALADLVDAHPERGSRLWLADVYSVLQLGDLYDGIHPSREAHDKVGDAWLEVLVPLLTR